MGFNKRILIFMGGFISKGLKIVGPVDAEFTEEMSKP